MKEKLKKARTPTIHGKDILLNKKNLKSILESKGMEYKDLHEKVKEKYMLDLSYKGFMTIISNSATWKLLYAYAITDVLNIDMLEIFDIVDIDVEKKKMEKVKWKEKYQN